MDNDAHHVKVGTMNDNVVIKHNKDALIIILNNNGSLQPR